MMEDRPIFEVVVLALCPEEHFRRFCDHYLAQGAVRIRAFHDRAPDYGAHDPRIDFTVCDDTYWSDQGIERPFSIEARQRGVYRQAYAECPARWLLVVDIDEFVFGPVSLDQYLAGLDETPDCVRFTSAEAVYGASDDIHREFGANFLRLPMERHASPLLSRLIYGSLGSLFVRGLLGHSRGKQAVRTGQEALHVDIHDAWRPDWETTRFDATRHDHFRLAHFDAISFRRWSEKCANRLSQLDAQEMGRKRERQITLFAKCKSQAERERLFRRLYALAPWQTKVLSWLGLLCETPFHAWQAEDQPSRNDRPSAVHSSLDCSIARRHDAYSSVR